MPDQWFDKYAGNANYPATGGVYGGVKDRPVNGTSATIFQLTDCP